MTHATPKPRETACLATWRSGYAADCKSKAIASDNNAIPDNRYQDIPGTGSERDNRDFTLSETKNAAPSAKGSGVKSACETGQFQAEGYGLDRLTASLSLHCSTRSAVALLASLTTGNAAFERGVQRLEKGARA